MTISNSETRTRYISSGQRTFDTTFEFFDPIDLRVRVRPPIPAGDDDFTDLIYGVDYTVTGGLGASGTVELLPGVVVPTGNIVELTSTMEFGQVVAYQKHGPFPAEAHERALDRLSVQIKQVAYNAGVAGGEQKIGVLAFNNREGLVYPLQRDYADFYSNIEHTHSWSEIQNKPSTFPPQQHSHSWGQITGKPGTFPPSTHSHLWSDIANKPATYPPAGTTPGALQYRLSDTETGGSDYFRIFDTPIAAGLNIGVRDMYVFDSSVEPGDYRLVLREGYKHDDNSYGPDASIVGYSIDAPSIALRAPNLAQGERIVVGPNGVLVTEPSAIAPQIDRQTFAPDGEPIDVIEGVWVVIPINLVLTRDTFKDSGHYTLQVPMIADGFQNFDLEIEALINGSPSGITTQVEHTENIGFFYVTLSDQIQSEYSAGDIISFRIMRVGASSVNVTIPVPDYSVTLEFLHFGQNPGIEFLNDLADVVITAPTDGDVLTWNENTNVWEAQTGGGGGVAGVTTFNSRQGNVVSVAADYETFYKDISYTPQWTEIVGKPTLFPPLTHDHSIGEVTGLQAALDAKSFVGHVHAWDEITNKPGDFPPEYHSHIITDVADLATELNLRSRIDHTHQWLDILGKPGVFPPESHSLSSHSDVVQVGAETNMVLTYISGVWVPRALPADAPPVWDEIVGKPSTFPPSAHVHQIADVVGLTAALGDKADLAHTHVWADITDPPSEFPPSAHALGDHSNVDEAGAVNGYALLYQNGNWAPGAVSTSPDWDDVQNKPTEFPPSAHVLDTHSDVNTAGATEDQVLTYLGGVWQPSDKGGAGAVDWDDVTNKPATFPPADHVLMAHSDVDQTIGPVEGQVLTWSAGQNAWRLQLPPGAGPGGTVSSVFGRTGNVLAEAGDYASYYLPVTYVPAWGDLTGVPAEFPPSAHALDDHSNVDETGAGVGDVLTYNGGFWVPGGAPEAPVTAVFGRTGEIAADGADYAAFYLPVSYAPDWGDIGGKPADFPPSAHVHAITDVTGLTDALDGKASSVHTHNVEDVTGLVEILDGKALAVHTHVWADITDPPAEFPPEAHTHSVSEVVGLGDALDDKADAVHTHSVSEVVGLGDALDDKAGVETVASGTNAFGFRTISTVAPDPLDGVDGDIWYVVEA